ncbi:MAG TPA: hypothetical protein DER09_06520 [Prolixibacteraceae bacterium]|nr:hypothetical protein [Prolixibacteraceae bacterium]
MFTGICMFVLHFKRMKTEGKIPFLIVAAFAWIVIVSSCANVGMPEGGPRDTIPPVLLKTEPGYKSVNYKGDDVQITFNEFINTEGISEVLVISPPMIKKPLIRTKSKTLVIEFNEDLKDSTTYSLDFKSSVADNNEKNPIEDFRFSFSTGSIYDSLKVAGTLANAFNLKPIENGLVLLHKNLHDSAIFRVRPDYIAKTNKEGQFLIDNIAPGKYHLFSMNDANNNLLYDEGAEEIAFYDSLIVPTSEYISEIDTIKTATDTIVIFGHTHFYPEDVMLQQFTEDLFNQYLESYQRDSRFKCTFVFGESVKDSFGLRLLNTKPIENWYQMEYTETMDSLIIWIADTTAAKLDTLIAEVSYFQLDSLEKLFVKNDTLILSFLDTDKELQQKRKKPKDGEEEEPEPIEQFTWKTSLTGSTVELNKKLGLIAPEPVLTFDSTMILLYHTEDTLKTPLKFKFAKDTVEWRRYNIDFPWQAGTAYSLVIDSASATNIFGITSRSFKLNFTTREEDFYGTLTLNLSGVDGQVILQLLSNSDDEKVIEERITNKNGAVLFDYLLPEKYRVKVIYDRNENGKWNTGSFQDKSQPERVMYINHVHKVRSNWEETLNWDLTPDDKFIKKIRDLEEEEKKRKQAEEKAKKEREEGNKQEMQNFIQGSGTGSGILR